MSTTVCAVCGLVLDKLTRFEHGQPDRSTWVHPGGPRVPRDHPAVPVDSSAITPEYHCDFCFAVGERHWRVPSRTWVMAVIGENVHTSGGDWAACDECAELIDADEWEQLLDRVMRSIRRRHAAERRPLPISDELRVRAMLREQYKQLRKHRKGPLVPPPAG